jgi:hypothetical protein
MSNDNMIAFIIASFTGSIAAMFAVDYLCAQSRKIIRIFKKD